MNNLILYLIFVIAFLYLLANSYQPRQGDIQDNNYINESQSIKDYPYPQISRTFKRLSKGEIISPLNNLSEILPQGDNNLTITKDNNNLIFTQREYLPDYYRKDRLNENPEGTEELSLFENNNNAETSWTDKNVSEHPKFYNANIKNELTNTGSFFDKNNQYNDKTSPQSEPIITDSCYTTPSGETFCQDNTRLQLIPPKLISDVNKCQVLNDIGIYKDNNNNINQNERIINGGKFYNNVSGSINNLMNWSNPIQLQGGECSI